MKNNKKGKFKYQANSIAIVVVFIALIIALNAVVNVLNKNVPLKLDLTSKKIYEFSEQTKNVVKNLEEDVVLYYIGTKANSIPEISETLSRYQTHSDKIKVEYIDPKGNPTFGKKYVPEGQSLSANSVIVTRGDRYKTLSPSDFTTQTQQGQTYYKAEQTVTSAINYVVSDENFVAYISTGNGEVNSEGIKSTLKLQNYAVNDIDLMTQDIPDDTKVLLLYSPNRDYSKETIAKFDAFMEKGGQMQIYLPPTIDDSFTNLKGFLNEWGLDFADDILIETSESNYADLGEFRLMLPNMVEHEISTSMKNANLRIGTMFSRSVKTLFTDTSGYSTKEVLTTSASAYSREDYATDTNIFVPNATDVKGTFPILVTSQRLNPTTRKTSRILLCGSDLMLADQELQLTTMMGLANSNLFENSTGWMQDVKTEVSISAKPIMSDYVKLDAKSASVLRVMAFAIPILILILGFIVWFKRRNL